eukprot:UN00166
MFARTAFAQATLRRVAARKFGSHAGPDTSYDPMLNSKFMLPPIPKDGIHRRKRIDLDAHGPWARNADTYIIDGNDLMTWFDRNAPNWIQPGQIPKQFLINGGIAFIPTILYCAVWPLWPQYHYGISAEVAAASDKNALFQPLPELISHPNAQPRQLVTRFLKKKTTNNNNTSNNHENKNRYVVYNASLLCISIITSVYLYICIILYHEY